MKFEKYKKYSPAYFADLARKDDVEGLLESFNAPEVQASAGRLTSAIKAVREAEAVEAVPAICKLLDLQQPEPVRRSAARALGPLGDQAAVSALCAALADPSKRVQMWSMKSLGELRGRQCVSILMQRLEDPDWGIREYAVSALGRIGDQSATEAVIPLLNDRSSTVRRSAITALVELRDPRGVKPLEEAKDAVPLFRRHLYSRGLNRLKDDLG